jgi:hypothetical protein
MVAVRKHGIQTIDSGPGPLYVLVLKDPGGSLYYIHDVSLGINRSDRFISFKADNSQPVLLDARSFTTVHDVNNPSASFNHGQTTEERE